VKPKHPQSPNRSGRGDRADADVVTEKLQKVLARAGVASRRTAEEWILEGRVSVDGKVATLGDRVSGEEIIRVDGKPVKTTAAAESVCRVVAYNKPEGEVCTRTDPEGRPTVFNRLPKLKNERWVCVGRLDINTQGLLLFTTDGELANKLMHPSSQVEREYAVRVKGELTEEQKRSLLNGIQLEDGLANFNRISDASGSEEGSNHWYHVVISEGRKREVRRMFEAFDLMVSRLIRIRYGHFQLPRTLPQGRYLELDKEDIEKISESVGVALKKRTGLYGRKKVRAHRANEKTKNSRRGYLRTKK
jgi:23S rRNA pseudouridine2605 synthase